MHWGKNKFKIASLNTGKESMRWLNIGQIKERRRMKRITKSELVKMSE